jgi:hypothetical protein
MNYVFNRCARTGKAKFLSDKLFIRYNDFYTLKNVSNERCPNLSAPIVYTNYDVFSCCNSCFFDKKDSKKNYFLGNLKYEKFSDICTKLITNPVYNLLSDKGPTKLYKLFEKELKKLGFKIKNRYPKLGMCELCRDLLSKEKYINLFNSKLKLY